MPGFLTNLFDAGEDGPGATIDQPTIMTDAAGGQPADTSDPSPQHGDDTGSTSDGGQGSSQSDSDTSTLSGHQDLGIGVDVGIGASGTYHDADGTTDWSHSNDVGIDFDTSAIVATTTTIAEDGAQGDY